MSTITISYKQKPLIRAKVDTKQRTFTEVYTLRGAGLKVVRRAINDFGLPIKDVEKRMGK